MKKINKIFVGVLSLTLLNPVNSNALTKTEMVHASLDYTGNVKNTIVNTKLTKIDSGDIVDYTYLTDIKNLIKGLGYTKVLAITYNPPKKYMPIGVDWGL